MTTDLSVYLVTDSAQAQAAGHELVDLVTAAVSGGVTTVQLREKDAPARDFLDLVCRVAAALPADVTLLVNDRVDVFLAARNTGARVDGVHVGQTDLPTAAVRSLVGADALIGVSASTPEQLAEAVSAGADYVGIGVVHPTRSKRDAPPALGIDGFTRLTSLTAVPTVAIGGITEEDLPALRRAGTAGAAVVSAVCAATDPGVAASRLRAAWVAGA